MPLSTASDAVLNKLWTDRMATLCTCFRDLCRSVQASTHQECVDPADAQLEGYKGCAWNGWGQALLQCLTIMCLMQSWQLSGAGCQLHARW